MTAKADDEALRWAGDTDPTHVDAPEPSAPAATAAPATATAAAGPTPRARADRAGMSSALLLTLGILAGVYLLYTVGWFVSVWRTVDFSLSAFDELMYSLRVDFAIGASAIWYAVTLLLTRRRKPIVRLLWLLLGVVVLVPWPFVWGVR